MLHRAVRAVDARAVVARAASIDERLARAPLDAAQTDRELGARRLQEWREVLVRGDRAQFLRRLRWDGLDEQRLLCVLGAVDLPADEPLPGWATLLAEACELAAASDAAWLRDTRAHAAAPLPFEELLAPFVLVARRRLRERAGTAHELLDAAAHRAIEEDLFATLALYAGQTLFLEFSIAHRRATSPLARLLAEDGDGRALYEGFVDQMLHDGLAGLFAEYGVLARQMATVTLCWVDAQAELLERLAQDWTALADAFAPGGTLRRVVAVGTGLSDPHRGRRSVLALTFDEGTRVVYKPKDLGIEQSFQELLAWLARRDRTLDARLLRVLARDGYGWVEHVEHRPCADREQAARYFRRAGSLLCVVYLLEGVDCHRGNLVADGEYPVLVDCEALLQPRQRLDDMADAVLARYMAYEQMSQSVLRSGLLPAWQIRDDGRRQHAYDVSALGGVHVDAEELQRPVWTAVNTDRMQLTLTAVKTPVKSTGAVLEGRYLALEDWTGPTIEGFTRTYRLLMRHRDALLADDGPLVAMARQPVRFIYRDTQVYTALCQKLMAPEFQRDGVRRSIQLDLLCRVMIPQETQLDERPEAPSWWPVAAAERRMMQLEDVPYYQARPTENVLVLAPGEELSGLFQGPSWALVVARVRGMDETDLARQVGYIAGSAYSRVARPAGPRPVTRTDAPDTRGEPGQAPAAQSFTAAALAIAEEIARRAIRSERSATWIGPQFMYRAERYQLQPLNNDLYTGAGGVLLFLAACARVTGDQSLRRLALAAAAPLRDDVENAGDLLARAMGIGGAMGLGSLVYAFTTTARLLDDPSMLDAARRAAALITDERIAADVSFDVFEGAAGALLGLLALHRATGDPAPLERALACGRHLLAGATREPGGRRAWVTLDDRRLGGFSHGAAGIACALLRLCATSPSEPFLALAREAIEYEDSLFDAQAGNWLDLRADPAERLYTASWCHGAPGIALGRLGGLPVLDDARVREDVEAAVRTMAGLALHDVDHVCCGNLGIDDILLTASQRLARPELAALARRRTEQVVARARETGAFALDPLLSHQVYCPNFFQGTAGIGYTLLRHDHPEELPSVLLFE